MPGMPDYRGEDIRKLHAEINQIVNQRFVLTTLAVTVFGVVTAWFIPRLGSASASSGLDPGTLYLIGTLLLILLFLFYAASHFLRATMRTLTIYLEVFELSDWEKHWKQYRGHHDYVGYTRIQTVFFLSLGALAVVVPLAAQRPSVQRLELWVEAAVFVVYVVLLIGMGYRHWWDHEAVVRERWKALKDKLNAKQTA
jgi:hypothetical protein